MHRKQLLRFLSLILPFNLSIGWLMHSVGAFRDIDLLRGLLFCVVFFSLTVVFWFFFKSNADFFKR